MENLYSFVLKIDKCSSEDRTIDNYNELIIKATELWLLIFNVFGTDDDAWTINYKHFKIWINNWDYKLCDYDEWVDLGGVTKELPKLHSNSKMKRKYY
jgi:hypothetical protein